MFLGKIHKVNGSAQSITPRVQNYSISKTLRFMNMGDIYISIIAEYEWFKEARRSGLFALLNQ